MEGNLDFSVAVLPYCDSFLAEEEPYRMTLVRRLSLRRKRCGKAVSRESR